MFSAFCRLIARLVAFYLTARFALGGKVLFISSVPPPSHQIFNRVLAVGLADKGHNVTVLSSDMPKSTTKSFHYIHVEKLYDLRRLDTNEFNL